MLIGNRDAFFPDMITDVITDLSDDPIRYETLLATYGTKDCWDVFGLVNRRRKR